MKSLSNFVGHKWPRMVSSVLSIFVAFGSATMAIAVDPPIPAPTPTHPQANVISLHNSSGTYTNVAIDSWHATWGDGFSVLTDHSIPATTGLVKKYSGLIFAGVEFYAPHRIDASQMTGLHVDLWTPDANKFGIKLVSTTTSGARTVVSGSTVITNNGWVSLDIPLSNFAGLDLANLDQLLWLDNGEAGAGGDQAGTFFIDNVYLYSPTTNGVHSDITSGTVIGWNAAGLNSYQPQKSSDNAAWTNLGAAASGSAVTSRFDRIQAQFYRILETTPSSASNSVPNGGFEIAAPNAVGATNWNIAVQPNSGASMSVVSQFPGFLPRSGAKFLMFRSITAPSGPVAAPNTDVRSDLFPVTAGAVYNLSFYAANPVKTGGANPQFHVFFYDGANGLVGSPTFTSFASVGSAWTQVSATLTPPSGASQMTAGWIQSMGADNGADWVTLIDDVSLSTGPVLSGTTNVLSASVQQGVQVSWIATNGFNYQVQSAPTVTSPWGNFGGLIGGNSATNDVAAPIDAPFKFYRVRQIQ